MIDPTCTKGWVTPHPTVPHTFVAHCGCGWQSGAVASKSKAKTLQRAHRFPPLPAPADGVASVTPIFQAPSRRP